MFGLLTDSIMLMRRPLVKSAHYLILKQSNFKAFNKQTDEVVVLENDYNTWIQYCI